MSISRRTVDGHLQNIYRKLGVRTRYGLAARLAGDLTTQEGGARPSGLPSDLRSFVGRDDQVRELVKQARSRRLITLVGPGGVGKTRLAIQSARALESVTRFECHYVDLSSAADAQIIDEWVRNGLHVRGRAGRSARQVVAERLGRGKALLVLDSCEHVIGAASSLVAYLLARCPDLHVLATSRQPLSVHGEHVRLVLPLELPGPARPLAADAATRYPALQLFVDRAQEAGAALVLDPAGIEVVAQICRRLDGLPLALELAAARTRALSIQTLLEMLEGPDRFQVLTGGPRTAAERHQALQATINWSYRLLGEGARKLLDRLSIFAGSFDLEAGLQVADTGADRAAETRQLIVELVDQSLLVAMPGPNGQGRYRLLDSVRAFGREALRRSGERERARQAHARYYARLLGPGPAHTDLSRWTPAIVDEMRAQMADCLAAVDWCSANQPVLATMITRRLVGFWGRQGPLHEGRLWLERVRARVPPDSIHTALAAANGAWLAQRQGDLDVADERAAEYLRVLRVLGRERQVGDALARQADVARHRGDHEAAARLFEQAVVLESKSAYNVAIDTMHLGNVEGRAGKLAAARSHLEAALAEFAAIGVPSGIPFCETWLAELSLLEGDQESAGRLLRSAAPAFRDLHDRWMAAIQCDLFAWLAVVDKEPERALRLAGAAAAIRDAMGAQRPPALTALVAPSLGLARASLGRAASRAWQEGTEADPEHIIAYALTEAEWGPSSGGGAAADGSGLTRREREVAVLIAQGLTNRQIGSRLRISVRTVEHHADQVRAKLGLRSRAQVAAWVAKTGLPDGQPDQG